MKLVALFIGLVLVQSAATSDTSIAGRVDTLGTGAPVPFAEVVLAPVAGTLDGYRTTVADAAGRFVFQNLRPGAFRVHAERQGFLRGESGSRTPGIVGTPVTVKAGETPRPVVVTLSPTGAITGRIMDADGPVRGALVRALRVVYRDGERYAEGAAAARADDRGEYRLFGLAPGSYLVDAVPAPRPRIEGDEYVVPQVASNANGNRRELRVPLAQALADGSVDPLAYERGIFVPHLYPGTLDEAFALPIDLSAGGTVPGIDLSIQPVQAVAVRGTVMPALPITSQDSLTIGVRRLGGASVGIPVLQERDGEFSLAAVPAGRYEMTARATGGPVSQFGRTVIDVGARDVTGVNISLMPGVRVKGRVLSDGAPVGGRASQLSVQLVAAVNGQSARQVAADGSFAFDNVAPQDYRLRIMNGGRTLPPSSIRFGAGALTDGIVRVTPERQGDELDIGVTLRTGGVDVTTTDRNGRAAAGITIALIPEVPRRRYSALFRTASSDTDGHVRFDDLAPGSYTVMSGDVAPAEWQNPDVIGRFERTGIAVRVEADSRARVSMVVP